MKSIFITYDQAHHENVLDVLSKQNCRGYTYLEKVQGRGSISGTPHHGSHAWPSMCSAIIAIVEDNKVESVLKELKRLDEEKEQLGLRAFVWNIETSI